MWILEDKHSKEKKEQIQKDRGKMMSNLNDPCGDENFLYLDCYYPAGDTVPQFCKRLPLRKTG